MTEPNPFAPPQEGVEVPLGRATSSGELADALRQLAAHVADARGAVERDRDATGPRVRVTTLVLGGLFVLAVLATLLIGLNEGGALLPIGIMLSILFALFAILMLVLDLSLIARDEPNTPEATFKSYLRAVSAGRNGYAWASLAPSARAQVVAVPSLGRIPTQPGEHSMQDEAGVKAYFGSFVRPGNGQMRQVALKKLTLASDDGDVARLDAELTFHSWPQWVSIFIALGFIFRPLMPLVLVGLVLLLVMRKRSSVAIRKTLLKAPTGVWYVHDADLLEDRRDLP